MKTTIMKAEWLKKSKAKPNNFQGTMTYQQDNYIKKITVQLVMQMTTQPKNNTNLTLKIPIPPLKNTKSVTTKSTMITVLHEQSLLMLHHSHFHVAPQHVLLKQVHPECTNA